MKLEHLARAAFVRQPWKNGGGSTTQLAVEGDAQRWLWRLSAAEVEQSGPFSDFSGYERTIMLLEGAGMDLDIGGRTVILATPFEPLVFDGAAKTTCTLLRGAVRDLNLIVDRARARGSIQVIDPDRFRVMSLHAPYVLVHALRGWSRVTVDGHDLQLAPGELLRIDDARGADLHIVGLERKSLVALILVETR